MYNAMKEMKICDGCKQKKNLPKCDIFQGNFGCFNTKKTFKLKFIGGCSRQTCSLFPMALKFMYSEHLKYLITIQLSIMYSSDHLTVILKSPKKKIKILRC